MLQVAQRDARIAALEEICRHRDSSATPAKQVHLSPHPESAPTASLLQAAAVPTNCVACLHMHHTMPTLLTMLTLQHVEDYDLKNRCALCSVNWLTNGLSG